MAKRSKKRAASDPDMPTTTEVAGAGKGCFHHNLLVFSEAFDSHSLELFG